MHLIRKSVQLAPRSTEVSPRMKAQKLWKESDETAEPGTPIPTPNSRYCIHTQTSLYPLASYYFHCFAFQEHSRYPSEMRTSCLVGIPIVYAVDYFESSLPQSFRRNEPIQ